MVLKIINSQIWQTKATTSCMSTKRPDPNPPLAIEFQRIDRAQPGLTPAFAQHFDAVEDWIVCSNIFTIYLNMFDHICAQIRSPATGLRVGLSAPGPPKLDLPRPGISFLSCFHFFLAFHKILSSFSWYCASSTRKLKLVETE